MKIGNIEIKRNAPEPKTPQPVIADSVKNSYADSAAGRLAAAGFKVSVNGRPTGQAYSQEQLEELYRGYIFGAIRKTRNKVAEILTNNTEVYDPGQGNPKDAPALEERHPYMDAIDNATMDNTVFYQAITTFMMLLGEAYIFAGERTMVAGNIKPVSQFEILQSNLVSRTYDDDGDLKTFKLTERLPNGLPKVTHYVPTNIILLKDINPIDLKKGYGLIRPVIDGVGLENTATKLQIATLGNALKAPGVVSTKEKVEKDDFEDLKHQIETRYTSNDMDKAGTPIVTNGGFIDYKSLLEDLDKLAMQKIRNMNRDSFFAALAVSKTILGIEESGTTRDTSRVQTENFILDACMPMAEAILNGLNQDYINNYPADYARKKRKMRAIAPIGKDVEQEKAEAELAKARAETFKVYVDAGLEPELAAKLAGVEVPEGEKIVLTERQPVNTITLTTEQLAILRNVGAAGTSPVPVEVHQHNHAASQHDPLSLAKVAKNQLSKTQQQKLNAAEANLRKQIRTLDSDLGALYVKQVNQLDQEQQEQYINDVADALLAYYLVALPIFGQNRAKQLAQDYGTEIVPFVLNDAVKQEVRQRLSKVANGHFATIDGELSKIINDGVRDNLPRDVVIKQVREKVSNDVAVWEVERLVDTETGNAFRQSTYYSDKQFITAQGYTGKAYKVWRTNSPQPCPFCTSLAGTRIPFDDNFLKVGDVAEATTQTAEGKIKQVYYPVRFVDVNAGGLHPNCKCDYQLVLE